MNTIPFPHHGPLAPEQVHGRNGLVIDLAQRMADRRVTALLGPRRYGKTSVMKKVAADLEATDQQVIWLDLYELRSMTDLLAAIDAGLSATRGAVRRTLDTVASGMSINLGVAVFELNREARADRDPANEVRRRLDVITTTAERMPLCLFIDEFAGIDGVDGGAGMLRTALQHHTQELGLLFAGSQPSVMEALFTDQAQPFFGQADLVEIEPLDTGAVVELVHQGFAATGKSAGAVAGRIAELTRGHPQRTMQLADAVWRATGADADDVAWESGLAEVRRSVDLGSERIFSLLTGGQQKALRALATGGSIYGRAARDLELPSATAKNAVVALERMGFVVRIDEAWHIVDPFLVDWLGRRFV